MTKITFSHNGVQPTRTGALPPRAHLHAAMLDPHTAAELDLDQNWQLVNDLISAHGGWLPEYH